jgi:hypothetical protein
VVGQQRLEMFKNLRKGHQVLRAPVYPVPEILKSLPMGYSLTEVHYQMLIENL